MKIILVGLLAVMLAACATSKPIVGPNGTPAYSIICGAAVINACYEKAGEVCPNGYVILNTDGSRYLGQIGNASVSGAYGSATSIPMVTPNNLLVECRAAK